MARLDMTGLLSAVLESYLDERQATWMASGRVRPTLPAIGGKVNVQGLVADLMRRDPQVRADDQQHFYRKPALRDRVNEVASTQGLKGIGSRLPDKGDEAVRQRIVAAERTTSDLRREAAEREALIEAQRAEIAALREQFRMLEETGMVLRAGGVS